MRKRLLTWALWFFIIYFIAVYPTEAATLIRSTGGAAVDLATAAAQSMSEFVRELT